MKTIKTILAIAALLSGATCGYAQEILDRPYKPFFSNTRSETNNEVKYKECHLHKAGELEALLGDDISKLDSLVVTGPLADEDFHTMWRASAYGGLTVLNLEDAEFPYNAIPHNAFWYHEEQIIDGTVYYIPLRRVMLPNSLEEIGISSFEWCMSLEQVNMPTSLRLIGERAFMQCSNLKMDKLMIPEGNTQIGELTFYNCPLKCDVTLPSGIKSIGTWAFCQSGITSINLPEGLKTICSGAFHACNFKEITIPSTCTNFPGSEHFRGNLQLEEIILSEGMKTIPEQFLSTCIKLEKVNIPSSVKEIGDQAFYACEKLKSIELPEGLERIGDQAFFHMVSLEEITFPSTLKYLGEESCMLWDNVKKISCKALIPPVCYIDETNPLQTPFGKFKTLPYNCTDAPPLYVPLGTYSAYFEAPGWSYFVMNIHESANLTPASVEISQADMKTANAPMYDMLGREIKSATPGQIYIQNGKKQIRK